MEKPKCPLVDEQIKKKGNVNPLVGMLVGMQTSVATREDSMELLWKLKIELWYDLAIPHPGIYPKEMKTGYQSYYTPMFIVAWENGIQQVKKQVPYKRANRIVSST